MRDPGLELQVDELCLLDTNRDPTETEMFDIYCWIDSLVFSRPKKNIARDFSDGVLMAELIAQYLPQYVNVRNFYTALSKRNKVNNWDHLNAKVFSKMGFKIDKKMIDDVMDSKPGCIEKILFDLRPILARRNRSILNYRQGKAIEPVDVKKIQVDSQMSSKNKSDSNSRSTSVKPVPVSASSRPRPGNLETRQQSKTRVSTPVAVARPQSRTRVVTPSPAPIVGQGMSMRQRSSSRNIPESKITETKRPQSKPRAATGSTTTGPSRSRSNSRTVIKSGNNKEAIRPIPKSRPASGIPKASAQPTNRPKPNNETTVPAIPATPAPTINVDKIQAAAPPAPASIVKAQTVNEDNITAPTSIVKAPTVNEEKITAPPAPASIVEAPTVIEDKITASLPQPEPAEKILEGISETTVWGDTMSSIEQTIEKEEKIQKTVDENKNADKVEIVEKDETVDLLLSFGIEAEVPPAEEMEFVVESEDSIHGDIEMQKSTDAVHDLTEEVPTPVEFSSPATGSNNSISTKKSPSYYLISPEELILSGSIGTPEMDKEFENVRNSIRELNVPGAQRGFYGLI